MKKKPNQVVKLSAQKKRLGIFWGKALYFFNNNNIEEK